MSDAAFKSAPFAGYTTKELEVRMINADDVTAAKMRAEIERRAKRDAGDRSVMTPGERLRNPLSA